MDIDIERQVLVQAGLGLASVVVFIVLVVAVGSLYAADGLGDTGAFVMVGVIVVFVVLMAILGLWFGEELGN